MSDAEAWLDLLAKLYEWAYRGRLMELNGGRAHEWRGDGLHQWSYLWGQVDALTPAWLRELLAQEPELLDVTPKALREAAHADATDEFTERLLLSARAQPQTEEEETEAGTPASVSKGRKRPRS